MFSSTLKGKAGVFKFLQFKERFCKAPLSRRFSVDGRPNPEGEKLRFWNISGVAGTQREFLYQMLLSGFMVANASNLGKCPKIW